MPGSAEAESDGTSWNGASTVGNRQKNSRTVGGAGPTPWAAGRAFSRPAREGIMRPTMPDVVYRPLFGAPSNYLLRRWDWGGFNGSNHTF